MTIPFFFSNEKIYVHEECKKFSTADSKCTARNVLMSKKALACKNCEPIRPQKRDIFECKHCFNADANPKEVERRQYTAKGEDVIVAFFQCRICGKIMAMCQLDYQRVWAVGDDEEYCDIAWLEKILKKV